MAEPETINRNALRARLRWLQCFRWPQWQRFSWQHMPLKVKLPLTMTTLVVLAVAGVTLLSLWREQQAFRSELERQADAMLDMLTTSVDDALYNLDVDALWNVAVELKNYPQTIRAGTIYDAEGRIIVDSLAENATFSYGNITAAFQSEPDALGQQYVGSPTTVFQWHDDRLLAGRAVMAGRETLGAISIALPTAPLLARMHDTRMQGISVAVVAAVVGMLLALLVSRSVLRPVREMDSATGVIAAGNLQHQVAVRSRDELGVLAMRFNGMVEQLRAMMERQAQHQAELVALLQARSDAVRAVVHDLNHTVQAIQSSVDVWMMSLAHTGVDMKLLETGQVRLQNVLNQQRDLLQDMRDAALLESGNLVLQPQETDLLTLVQQTAAPLLPRYELAECTLTITADPALPLAWCDGRRMRRVIFNLLENALRYTSSFRDDGAVAVHLSAEEDYLVCAIEDNGSGIHREHLARLGAKFARLARGEGDPDGMGLGLNFAIGIVQLSGGHLTIDSPGAGCGTTVTVRVPAVPMAREIGQG